MVVQLRPAAIDLARLRSWAAEGYAEADGARYSAERFVQWVERSRGDRADDRGNGTREAGQRRRRG